MVAVINEKKKFSPERKSSQVVVSKVKTRQKGSALKSLSTEEIIQAVRHLGSDYEEMALNLESYIKSSEDKFFKIVNAGTMNPGKSTLLNAIIGKNELFKTADARQTVITQKEKWGKNIYLYDTPGCSSAVLTDDAESYAAFRESDLIVFIHNLMNGGLVEAELSLLKGICGIYGEKDFVERVCVVGTRLDQCSDDEIDRNMGELKQLVCDNLKVDLKTFVVSSTYHLEGLKLKAMGNLTDATSLIEEGGVEKLKKYLRAQIKKLGKRSSIRIKEYVNKLSALSEKLKTDNFQMKEKLSQAHDEAKTGWKTTLLNIKPAWQECK